MSGSDGYPQILHPTELGAVDLAISISVDDAKKRVEALVRNRLAGLLESCLDFVEAERAIAVRVNGPKGRNHGLMPVFAQCCRVWSAC